MSSVSLEQSHAHCHEVTRTRARNFYYGMKLTPEPKRSAMYAVYAWMRLADDLADEAGDPQAKIERIERFRSDTLAVLEGKAADDGDLVWPAIADTVKRYNIPLRYLHAMIDGQILDQHKTRYATFEELYDYCYKVASVVGLTCIQIWGYEGGNDTRQLSEWRGIAFQLTNILRDVKEDAERDRVYLPASDFDVHELTPSMFLFGKQPEAIEGLQASVDRAADYYRQSAPLDRYVSRDGLACLWAMTRIYHGIFRKIQQRPAQVLDQRVRLSSMHKASIALRSQLKARVGL